MIEVSCVEAIEELESYRLPWALLVEQTASASFFQTLDWLKCYWKHYGDDQKLCVFVVKEQGRPLGILPLVIRRESTRVGSMRVLTYPLHDWGSFYAPIGPNPTATLLASLRALATRRRDWDILDLRWVDVANLDRGRTQRAMEQTGFSPMAQQWDETSLVELNGDWPSYWSAKKNKFRKNIERCEHRLAEQGRLELVRHRPLPAKQGDGDPRWDLYDQCLNVAQRSWQGESQDGTTMTHAQVQRFLRDAHEAAANNGAADLNLLALDGKPIAYAYNYVWQGRVYGLRKGFDGDFRSLGPGLVLQKLMLEDGVRRGDSSYDLGVGSVDSKKDWLTKTAASHRFTYFPATMVRSQILRWNRMLRRSLRGKNDVACNHPK